MDVREYLSHVKKTESGDFSSVEERLRGEKVLRLLHGALGLSTEAGEVLDGLKKHIFYGRSLDEVNLVEEMGDLFWYLILMADALNVDFEEVMKKNVAKLAHRYPQGFESHRAEHRDLEGERSFLEGKSS